MSNDEYHRWSDLRNKGCIGHPPFDEQIYGMNVIWEITKKDAERFNLTDTEAVALAGEWSLERLRAYFTMFRDEKIAGENGARDHVYDDLAASNVAFKKEVRICLLNALRAAKYVQNASVSSSACIVNICLQKNFRQSAVSFHTALNRLHVAAVCMITNGICTKASSMFTIKSWCALAARMKRSAAAKSWLFIDLSFIKTAFARSATERFKILPRFQGIYVNSTILRVNFHVLNGY